MPAPSKEETLQYWLSVQADKPGVEEAVEEVRKVIERKAKTLSLGSRIGGGIVGGMAGVGKGMAGIGGMIGSTMGAGGAAVGAGAGMAGGALMALPNLVKSTILAPVNMLSEGLHELQGPLGVIGMVLPSVLKDITTSLVSMAEKASPGQFKMWQVALEDTQGVIGQAFLPVLEMMREGVRLFADVLANILPNSTEARNALSEFRIVFAGMGKDIRDLMAEIGPAIRGALIEGLKVLAHWLAVAAKAVGILAQRLKAFFVASGVKGDVAARSSVGASAQPVHIEDITGYRQRLQMAAFAAPGTKTPEQEQLDALEGIQDATVEAQRLLTNIESGITAVVGVAKQTWEVLTTIGMVVKNIGDFVMAPKQLVDEISRYKEEAKKSEELDLKVGALQKKLAAQGYRMK